MELDEKFFKNYKELIIVLCVLVMVLFVCYQPVASAIKKTKLTMAEYKKQVAKVKDVKTEVASIEDAKNQLIDKQKKLKPFFEQKGAPEDSVASFGGMFEDVIDYVKMNRLMLRSVEYSLTPKDDVMFEKFPLLYNVCRIKLYMIGSYPQLQSFLNDISVYPYFIDVSEVNIVPYKKDMQYLVINVSLTLYSKKQKAAASV